jgi:hypothetical protein
MQTPDLFRSRAFVCKYPGDDLLSHGQSAISSARRRFTALFGMGRGGANALWSPGILECVLVRLERSRAMGWKVFGYALHRVRACKLACTCLDAQGYRVKPHGQLVLVSSRHYCPYTPSLSTSWSRTTLQGSQAPGRSHLQASFPLRCFQRLSLPHIATRQCHWRDNRYTRDASTPVLSY